MLQIQSKKRVGYWAWANPFKYLSPRHRAGLSVTIGLLVGLIVSLIVYPEARTSWAVVPIFGMLVVCFMALVAFYQQVQRNIWKQQGMNPNGSLPTSGDGVDSYDDSDDEEDSYGAE